MLSTPPLHAHMLQRTRWHCLCVKLC